MSALRDTNSAGAELSAVPMLHPRSAPFKRAVDIVLASIALIVALPVIACLALIIRLDSPGPALFRQRRVGYLGRPFMLWKLRSMYHQSSQDYHLQVAQNWFKERNSGGRYKTEADPRITRVGKYLRRSSLDELPQLFNVLRGEMSLVGPRPMMHYDRTEYVPWYYEREVMKPGITGLWQVSGRQRLSAPEMMVLDVRYVHEWSLWLDVQIFARTLTTILNDLRPATEPVSKLEKA